ncbi:MAG: hypothetical protein HPY71_00930 [Firmicutes bacterium]|nr:hypothetical protein [Bacillota bacterium]
MRLGLAYAEKRLFASVIRCGEESDIRYAAADFLTCHPEGCHPEARKHGGEPEDAKEV